VYHRPRSTTPPCLPLTSIVLRCGWLDSITTAIRPAIWICWIGRMYKVELRCTWLLWKEARIWFVYVSNLLSWKKSWLTRLVRCSVILMRISTYPTIRGTHRCTSEWDLLCESSSWINGCLKCERLGARLGEFYLENMLYDTYAIHVLDRPTPYWARV